MNKIITLIIVLFNMNYDTNHQVDTNPNIISGEKISKHEEPYDLSLQVKRLKNDTYNLIIKMELKKDAHYVSPNSKGDYLGIFTMIMDKNTKLQMIGKFSESPLSEESVDPWNHGPVNFVRENTTHTQQFTISDTNDFEVSGFIQFTIEPRCTLEKVHFTISRKAGKLEIKKVTVKK
ncbi:hypothetical protein IMCC3317_29440 [Kordia antarctica]|uniref:Uncharacterized protein n=1 Tax=Kordia antarctica TaxID=1218801 RepID=A0A7L4ZNT3_9FLAO|nr:hypothetical protein [Kordia antarctica]QHI37564.1 hypothetical protein IMCC3317_29440 [Kordia antarctica]